MRPLLLLLALLGPARGAGDPPRIAQVDRLRWLAGCWEAASPGLLVEEQWMSPRGGTMLGMSRTVRGDTTVAHESMQIVERGGEVVFVARPSGQPPAEFVASEAGPDRAAFANPRHDFPQRILYRRVGADSLVARVEGVRAGRVRGFDFRYARTACPGVGKG